LNSIHQKTEKGSARAVYLLNLKVEASTSQVIYLLYRMQVAVILPSKQFLERTFLTSQSMGLLNELT